jgi:hypothetical protein
MVMMNDDQPMRDDVLTGLEGSDQSRSQASGARVTRLTATSRSSTPGAGFLS